MSGVLSEDRKVWRMDINWWSRLQEDNKTKDLEEYKETIALLEKAMTYLFKFIASATYLF